MMKVKEMELLETFESLYGVVIARITPDKITEELQDSIGSPHRHDCYTVMVIETGKADFIIDFQKIQLNANSLLLISPGQVHQSRLGKDVSGWIMLVDYKLVDQNIRFAIGQSLHDTIHLKVVEAELSNFDRILLSILEAVIVEDPGKSHHLYIRSLLNALLFKIVDLLYLVEENTISNRSSRAIEITRQYKQLVKENFRFLKKPSDYANRINISLSHLNDTVKDITGFSCTYLIQQELITEAQRLLFYTSKSIKEISYELGYHDYKYFIRLFGKVTKQTPLNFRKQAGSAAK